MSEHMTAGEALRLSGFSLYRKAALTSISDRTFPPGTVYETPEGLKAEDEDTRCAFDVQGGVYPIRESVFQASYELADAAPRAATEPPQSDLGNELREAAETGRRVHGWDAFAVVLEQWAAMADNLAAATEPLTPDLCPTCNKTIVKEAHGGEHPSAGDHDPAAHVAKAYEGWKEDTILDDKEVTK
jgi:hypothetical protein